MGCFLDYVQERKYILWTSVPHIPLHTTSMRFYLRDLQTYGNVMEGQLAQATSCWILDDDDAKILLILQMESENEGQSLRVDIVRLFVITNAIS